MRSLGVLASPRYQAADDSRESELCVSAANDALLRFRMNVRDTGYNLRSLSRLVTCNGAPIADFAMSAGNARNAGMLQRFSTRRGVVELREADAAQSTEPRWAQSDTPPLKVSGRRAD